MFFRKVFLSLTLVAFCSLGLPVRGAEQGKAEPAAKKTTEPKAESRQVRILTYNIHHGEGMDRKFDLPRIAAVIKATKPDIVALQEVDNKTLRAMRVDQAARLGKLTGMHAIFGKAMDFRMGQYGEAILSRYPMTDTKTHALPHTKACEPRCALEATIHLGKEENAPTFRFVATHLEHADKAVRLSQAKALCQLFGKETDSATPLILAGDLNSQPGSPPIKVLTKDWTDATAGNLKSTWPSDKPKIKVDYVMFRPANRWRVVEVKVIDDHGASDHRPVLVVLERVK